MKESLPFSFPTHFRLHEDPPDKMKTQEAQEHLAQDSGWKTTITRIESNRIEIAGYPLRQLIGRKSLPELAFLLFTGTFPEPLHLNALNKCIREAARPPSPRHPNANTWDLPGTLARDLLLDKSNARTLRGDGATPCEQALACVGRLIRYLAAAWKTEASLDNAAPDAPFSHLLACVCMGSRTVDENKAAMLEAMTVATVDHGVTAPSAQAAILAGSVRAPYEVAVSHGIGTITSVHGGAGEGAAHFFRKAVRQADRTRMDLAASVRRQLLQHVRAGKRIPGLGHRFHTSDPRADSLFAVAEQTGNAGASVRCARCLPDQFQQVSGRRLPINVDGAIGAVAEDMGCRPVVAKAVFILGRTCGLSAHYFEEITNFPAMRWIDFNEAVYAGPPTRSLPPAPHNP